MIHVYRYTSGIPPQDALQNEHPHTLPAQFPCLCCVCRPCSFTCMWKNSNSSATQWTHGKQISTCLWASMYFGKNTSEGKRPRWLSFWSDGRLCTYPTNPTAAQCTPEISHAYYLGESYVCVVPHESYTGSQYCTVGFIPTTYLLALLLNLAPTLQLSSTVKIEIWNTGESVELS